MFFLFKTIPIFGEIILIILISFRRQLAYAELKERIIYTKFLFNTISKALC